MSKSSSDHSGVDLVEYKMGLTDERIRRKVKLFQGTLSEVHKMRTINLPFFLRHLRFLLSALGSIGLGRSIRIERLLEKQ